MRILHVLSQRPSLTGSGVTLEAFVRQAARQGMAQRVAVGVPADAPHPPVGGLPPERIHPLVFESGPLDFPVPGMSDVMPYRSSVWSSLSPDQLGTYRRAWTDHLTRIIADFRPDLIHSHHIWILSGLLKDIAPAIPVVTSCHATGLRQLRLCPHLRDAVVAAVRRNERFVVLHGQHRHELATALDISPERIAVVGAGYREALFDAKDRPPRPAGRRDLIYAGKYSHAKGLPQLLDVLDALPNTTLHVAGSGASVEADALRRRMMARPDVVLHGMLDQASLATLMRRADVFVLPSFYEGLPLVLVEALACGCRLVCTRLPGVQQQLAPHLEGLLSTVALPRLLGPDSPAPEDLPAFVGRLRDALSEALDAPPLGPLPTALLARFSWSAVFERLHTVWRAAVVNSMVSRHTE